jgi:hypothetical protein
MSTPFKMKGFSGFGNSPLKQDKLSKKTIKKYEEKGISKKELQELNVTPSDTALTITHPDLGASSKYLIDEAKFSGGKISSDEHGNWEQDTQVRKTDKGYKRTSKFKKP